MKVLFYTCITHYYMGRQSEDQQKWGQCLAYYTLAQEKLNECTKLAKVRKLAAMQCVRSGISFLCSFGSVPYSCCGI